MNKRLFLIGVLALLSGCATKYDRLRNYAGQDFGTVVISLGQTRENTLNYSHVMFRLKGTEDLGYFEYDPKYFRSPSPKDFATAAGEGTLIVKKLAPGDYEITGFSTGADFGTSVVTYRNRSPLSIPFTVRTGATSYLGQYLVGVRKNVGAELDISDERQRDMKGSKSQPLLPQTTVDFVPRATMALPPEVRVVQ